jgi:glutamate dehydrogenase (NAD(P)+)
MSTATDLASDSLLDFTAELEQAARALDLEPWVVQRLKHAQREITVNLPLRRDSGETVNITGYRVQHHRQHGPCIGPLLISPEASTAQLRALAGGVTLQCALLDLPLGGAAGALVATLDDLSERELRHLVNDYVLALRHALGPMEDVLAPEINDIVTAWTVHACARAAGRGEPAAVVGKPAALGGIPDAREAAVGALAALLEQALSARKQSLAGARLAWQGFGSTAACAALRMQRAGARVVAVADRTGGVMSGEGLDVERLIAHRAQTGMIFGFKDARIATNAEVLTADCDALILAAAERQVGPQNAERVRAGVVFELVAGAVTASAERALLATGAEVVPSLLATAGTLRAWALEWEYGLRFAVPEPGETEAVVCARAVRAYEEARERGLALRCGLRTAAQVIALEKLAASMRLQ